MYGSVGRVPVRMTYLSTNPLSLLRQAIRGVTPDIAVK